MGIPEWDWTKDPTTGSEGTRTRVGSLLALEIGVPLLRVTAVLFHRAMTALERIVCWIFWNIMVVHNVGKAVDSEGEQICALALWFLWVSSALVRKTPLCSCGQCLRTLHTERTTGHKTGHFTVRRFATELSSLLSIPHYNRQEVKQRVLPDHIIILFICALFFGLEPRASSIRSKTIRPELLFTFFSLSSPSHNNHFPAARIDLLLHQVKRRWHPRWC